MRWNRLEKVITTRKKNVEIPRRSFLAIAQDPTHLTQPSAFARLKVAACSAERAEHVSRAEVAELADAHGSGPCTRKGVGVRVPPSAPNLQKLVPQTREHPAGCSFS